MTECHRTHITLCADTRRSCQRIFRVQRRQGQSAEAIESTGAVEGQRETGLVCLVAHRRAVTHPDVLTRTLRQACRPSAQNPKERAKRFPSRSASRTFLDPCILIPIHGHRPSASRRSMSRYGSHMRKRAYDRAHGLAQGRSLRGCCEALLGPGHGDAARWKKRDDHELARRTRRVAG